MMDENGIRTILLQSVKELITRDGILVTNKVREESINHRLAVYLELVLQSNYSKGSYYNVDVEYNKSYTNPKEIITDKGSIKIRPDILIHKRNSDENLLAVEAKKGYPSSHDRMKLTKLLNPPYNYLVTALVSYFPEKDYIMVITRSTNSSDELRIPK